MKTIWLLLISTCLLWMFGATAGYCSNKPTSFLFVISEGGEISAFKVDGKSWSFAKTQLGDNQRRSVVKHLLKELTSVKSSEVDPEKWSAVKEALEKTFDDHLSLNQTGAVVNDEPLKIREDWFYAQLNYAERTYEIEGWREDVVRVLQRVVTEIRAPRK
jgi:hypothetical protein